MINMQAYLSFVEDHIQDKRHIVITGNRGSGKTTLLKALTEKRGSGNPLPGIVTWSEPGRAVYMRQTGTDDRIVIGRFNPESTTAENRMCPVQEGFEGYGIAVLDNLINDSSEWVTMDETGYLEAGCKNYLKKLDELFDKKRVIIVVRKQDMEHIHHIINRRDTMVLDLDDTVVEADFSDKEEV